MQKPTERDQELDISPSMGAGNDKSACIAGAFIHGFVRQKCPYAAFEIAAKGGLQNL